MPIEEGEPETHRRTCAGCGSPLVIVRTDTVFLAAIPRQPTGEAAEARAGAMTDFWTALARRRG
ncbi:MAG: hypothetical protein J2P26_12140 [Nocardiopsaceae bacterium]|nr:hypothetical protein [Nocardiopsaceae bacterium]